MKITTAVSVLILLIAALTGRAFDRPFAAGFPFWIQVQDRDQEPNQAPGQGEAQTPNGDQDSDNLLPSGRPEGNMPDMSVEYNKLNAQARKVLINKATERAWAGKYVHNKAKGIYICRRCNAPLYESSTKFDSECGWPSFDQEIKGAVRKAMDADGVRIEILCENCGGHLGHVFYGEGFTTKNTRHCVNSISMNFIPANKPLPEVIRPKLSMESPAANAAGSKDNKNGQEAPKSDDPAKSPAEASNENSDDSKDIPDADKDGDGKK